MSNWFGEFFETIELANLKEIPSKAIEEVINKLWVELWKYRDISYLF